MIEAAWLAKLILAHLITDFLLQPKSWVEERNAKHFYSSKLYLHGLITAVVAFILTGFLYWKVALLILITHTLIDGWKSYQKQTLGYFIFDQFLHLTIIFISWYVTFLNWENLSQAIKLLNENKNIWKIIAAIVFVTTPASILIEQFTMQWQSRMEKTDTLTNAGKWIGIIERIIVLVFVLKNDYAAIGLLLAAKGLIRFNEKERPEIKTEYLVIGTLISIGIAIVTGLLVKA